MGECCPERGTAGRATRRRPLGGGTLPGLSRELVVIRRRGHGGSQTSEVYGETTKYLPRRALDVEQAQEEMFNSDLFIRAVE